jgi:hypothetical protein
MDDSADALLNVLALYRTFLQRPQNTGAKFGLVERFPPIVSFNDMRHHELCRFKRRVTLAAGAALTPTPYL